MTSESPDFVHLHVHTEYSLLDGAIRIDDLLKRAVEFNMPGVAITDHGTMHGVVHFWKKAMDAGIRPVIGCECYVAPRTINDRTPLDNNGLTHLVLLAENQQGYQNLCRLATIASLEGFYYKPRIDKSILEAHFEGLIGLSACLKGEIPRLLQAGKIKEADEAARYFQKLFGEGSFFLEVQHNGIPEQETVNQALLEMNRRLSMPLVATNDCHYLNKWDVRAHEVLLCIQTGSTLKDDGRFRFGSEELYFKSPEEMYQKFADYPGAIENTRAIADRCQVEFDFHTFHFPRFDMAVEKSESALFEEKTRSGFEKRMAQVKKRHSDVDEQIYQSRIDYEIGVINNMGFAGYFLIVADFIEYAKSRNIPVGPGRGSAAGSLVAYSLGITDLDPIENGLIFERFLNPDRKSMPDIDVDFCIMNREQVYHYVVDRYGGEEYVAQIITFGKMKARAVIRDVGRAMDIPLAEVDMIAKLVPEDLNISLDRALEQEPKLRALAESDSRITELIEISKSLEGLNRHASTHAAGVVIGDKKLVEYLPLYRGKRGEVLTQFDMKAVEKIGLVKFDFLGLRNLTIIADALSIIAAQGKTPPDMDHLPLDDAATYRLLSAGDTTAVFQLESSGMKDLVIRMKPENFADITALVALYRPGPMGSGMQDDYVEIKHGRRKPEYLIPQLEPILNVTYGVILYQEQVMKIAAQIANYTMAEADDLRKAMGKKIPEVMARQKDRFVKGSVENGIFKDKAIQLFDLIEKFAGYGFNKSHSAAYALIAYQTAYLKAHFPVEYMAAVLSSEMHSSNNVVKFISDCRQMNIPVLPPDINESDRGFTVSGDKIRFGLAAVKNVGESAIESIIENRGEGSFKSLFDFCRRVDLRRVNKRVVESLIQCGAFDSTGARRAQLASAVEDALDYGQTIQKEAADPQMQLFGGCEKTGAINPPMLPDVPEWDEKKRLNLEKESIGFYITGHPLDDYRDILEKFASTDTQALQEEIVQDKSMVRLGGIIRSLKSFISKRGDPMAHMQLEDMNGSVAVTIFPNLYRSVQEILSNDAAVFVQGMVQKNEKSVKILADSVIDMNKAEETWTASVHVTLDAKKTDAGIIPDLQKIFKKHPGKCSGYIHFIIPGRTETVMELSNMKLCPGAALTREVHHLLGYPAVAAKCSNIPSGSDHQRNQPKRFAAKKKR